MRALFEGRFEEAERLARQAPAVGQEAQGYLGRDAFVGQMFALRREQGRLAELEGDLRAAVEADASPYFLRSALALLCAEERRRPECSAYIGDRDSADELCELLLPYAGQCS